MNISTLDTPGKRIKFLLEINNIKNLELAKYLGVAPNTVSNYVNDDRQPDLYTFARIATFLDVSADFLLLLDNDYSPHSLKVAHVNTVSVNVSNKNIRLTANEIQLIFNNLDSIGWEIPKLIKSSLSKGTLNV